MAQLGFTFYPKDWWTSDTFYTLNPFERYIYLELLFMMYVNDGFVSNNRVNVERRLLTSIKEDVWLKITDLFVKDGDKLTHLSVNKRLKKTITNRKNGQNGGRPKNPKNPDLKPNENPPYKINEIKEKDNYEEVLKNWSYEKTSFLRNEQWMINFSRDKGIEFPELKILMQTFITDIELREDHKEAKELRSHFTYYFNKIKREKMSVTSGFKNERSTSAPLKTVNL